MLKWTSHAHCFKIFIEHRKNVFYTWSMQYAESHNLPGQVQPGAYLTACIGAQLWLKVAYFVPIRCCQVQSSCEPGSAENRTGQIRYRDCESMAVYFIYYYLYAICIYHILHKMWTLQCNGL